MVGQPVMMKVPEVNDYKNEKTNHSNYDAGDDQSGANQLH
jgi:hypothetical protein